MLLLLECLILGIISFRAARKFSKQIWKPALAVTLGFIIAVPVDYFLWLLTHLPFFPSSLILSYKINALVCGISYLMLGIGGLTKMVNKNKLKIFVIIGIVFLILFLVLFALGAVILLYLEDYYSQFEFEVKNVKFDNQWLNFTIYFKQLPEEGAKFTCIIVDGFRKELPDVTFYTSDMLSVSIEHKGKIKQLPDHAILWQTKKIGFNIPLMNHSHEKS